ncbi:hypothetical protein AB5J55_24080 [Streptomyces sp. R11]|uniref:Uncharacterized protein n=1 Tax=Streptomyces sp. R11 TaxID=3238625 RepID=A0AB39N3A8_9ACTN
MTGAHARAGERGRYLEHAAKLDPGVRAEVQRRAGELIPPRGRAEARELTELGPIVPEPLPGPEDLDEKNVYFAEELDLAPLAAHPRLKRVSTFTARLCNARELPHHRPRATHPPHSDE